jgi:hypothetical protein
VTQEPYVEPYPPTATTTTTTTMPAYPDEVLFVPETGTDDGTGPETSDVAKDEARDVSRTAADAGQKVAQTAKDQAAGVAGEAKSQAKDVLGQARTEVQGQADTQKQRIAEGLHSISKELSSMADGPDQQGLASDLARQASDTIAEAASWLEQRDPSALLGEVRSYARRSPAAFLGIALVAGVVSGRLARGMKDAGGDEPAGTL